jgi:hypothetical protein
MRGSNQLARAGEFRAENLRAQLSRLHYRIGLERMLIFCYY